VAKRKQPKRANAKKLGARLVGDERALVATVERVPRDHTARLVYADWLDERSDPRGEYLRLLCEVAQSTEANARREQCVARLQQLRADFADTWLVSMQRGLGWRVLLEANMRPFQERDYGELYQFGAPATVKQLAEAEAALGQRLPNDLRELLSEFNGVWCTSAFDQHSGWKPEILYLDLHNMTVEASAWHQGFPGILCFRAVEGFARVWAVCLQEIEGFPTGHVVSIDHDGCDVEDCAPSLFEFVRRGE
jgi:uncharacterized protein (TIGR02996 family)